MAEDQVTHLEPQPGGWSRVVPGEAPASQRPLGAFTRRVQRPHLETNPSVADLARAGLLPGGILTDRRDF